MLFQTAVWQCRLLDNLFLTTICETPRTQRYARTYVYTYTINRIFNSKPRSGGFASTCLSVINDSIASSSEKPQIPRQILLKQRKKDTERERERERDFFLWKSVIWYDVSQSRHRLIDWWIFSLCGFLFLWSWIYQFEIKLDLLDFLYGFEFVVNAQTIRDSTS